MPSSRNDALILIQEIKTLLKEENSILSCPEDADFFRKRIKKQPINPPPPEPLPKSLAPPSLPTPLSVKEPSLPITKPPAALKPTALPPPSAPFLKEEPTEKEEISAEPLHHLFSLKALFAKIAPEIHILHDIPSDAIAKKVAYRWKTKNQTAPLSILCFAEPPEQKALLEEITKALDVYFGPARLIHAETIEKENQWEAFLSVPDLKMIFVCDYTLWQLRELMRHYKETPAQGVRTLGTIPLFLLPDMSLYLKDPLLKRSLWKALCMKIAL